jgi:hypothetical protein
MADIKFCTDALRSLTKEKHLTERTTACFWRTFSNYKVENTEEYKSIFDRDDDSLIRLDNGKISLQFGREESCDTACVVVSYSIWFGERYIGGYHTVFSIDGEKIIDDIFFSE